MAGRTDVKISVIVPVYNVEKELPRCIESLLTQTYSNFELLLINDGSSDGSPEIMERYAEKDPRIRTLHKKNGGVSSARNRGLEQAKGGICVLCGCGRCGGFVLSGMALPGNTRKQASSCNLQTGGF